MSKYNKIYFLHIPKTGGRFFTKYILEPNESVLKQNGIDLIKLPANVMRHGGWHKDIDEKTYIISVLRDPVEFFASLTAHMFIDENGLMDNKNNQIVIDQSITLDIDKEYLFNTIEELEYLKNFQSQNFTLTPSNISFIGCSRKNYNKFGTEINTELLYERIKRTNLMIRHTDLKSMDYSVLINKISDDLGVKLGLDISFMDKELYKNNSSKILFEKLSTKDKEKIYNSFLLDKEIYENDSLFWKEK
jgi:hypothetical protein